MHIAKRGERLLSINPSAVCGTMRYSMNKGIKGKLIMIVCLSCDCYLKLASVHNQAVLHADPDQRNFNGTEILIYDRK